ncbi:hypothetical protein QAD02_016336, partial [Eretmocerus hayati]
EMVGLIEGIWDDWASESISNSSHNIIEKNIKTARILSYLIMASYGLSTIFFESGPVAFYFSGGVNEREFLIPIISFSWNLKQSPIYEVLMIIQMIQSVAGIYISTIVEGQLAFLVLHACSKVHIVKEEILKISQCSPKNASDSEEMHSIIKTISQKHSNFLTFSSNLHDAYAIILLIHVITLTLLIVTSGFGFLVATEKQNLAGAVFYATFVCSFLFSSGLYCYAGEQLTTQSETIATEIIRCPWYQLPIIHRKDINFILMRANEPVIMTAGKFSRLSLALLSS